jgi:hypothetical protein
VNGALPVDICPRVPFVVLIEIAHILDNEQTHTGMQVQLLLVSQMLLGYT